MSFANAADSPTRARGFNDEWQAASVRLRLFVRMLVVKAVTEHVFFVTRAW
jgi:hypothetical protein